jgi:hypothetical protein
LGKPGPRSGNSSILARPGLKDTEALERTSRTALIEPDALVTVVS